MKLETYLRRATSGTWGKHRAALIAELRGSIEARVWTLQCQGWNVDAALEMALQELGEPRRIAAGFTEVHTMPKLLKSLLGAGLLTVFTVSSLNPSRAQIEVAPFFTSPSMSATTNFRNKWDSYYLKFSSIKENLEAKGITVDDTPQGVLECCPNQKKPVPTLRFRFPGSTERTVLQAYPAVWRNGQGNLVWDQWPPAKLDGRDTYVPFWAFVWQLRERSGLSVQMTGWKNPQLVIGATTLQIGSEQSSATPWQIYASVAGRVAQEDYPELQGWQILRSSLPHAVRVEAPAGSVYAVITTSFDPNEQHLDVARVANDGVLYFTAPHRVLEFADTPLEVYLDRSNLEKPGFGSSKRPAKALLIRIASDFTVSFEIPARAQSKALK